MNKTVIQRLRVREYDNDPCCLWVKQSECPVYRHNNPFPEMTVIGSYIYCFGDGTILAEREM